MRPGSRATFAVAAAVLCALVLGVLLPLATRAVWWHDAFAPMGG